MPKMKLSLEDLQVDSFATAARHPRVGTVRGHEDQGTAATVCWGLCGETTTGNPSAWGGCDTGTCTQGPGETCYDVCVFSMGIDVCPSEVSDCYNWCSGSCNE